MDAENKNTFKVVLVGDGGVGKTSYVQRFITGKFTREYIATVGVDVYPIVFSTNYGVVQYNVWDTSGQEKVGELRDGYYDGGDCAIIMFDLSSRITYGNVPIWHNDLNRIMEGRPTVVCGNKSDVRPRKVKLKNISIAFGNSTYKEISAKANSFLEEPFLWLTRTLMGKTDLVFTKGPELLPPEAVVQEQDQQ